MSSLTLLNDYLFTSSSIHYGEAEHDDCHIPYPLVERAWHCTIQVFSTSLYRIDYPIVTSACYLPFVEVSQVNTPTGFLS